MTKWIVVGFVLGVIMTAVIPDPSRIVADLFGVSDRGRPSLFSGGWCSGPMRPVWTRKT